ncbi:MAG TPA: helix-turn-helix domain-containing protein [Burkholderiales bacterium]|nr:helix-turn-helix domain-containing protein [Burkholderiales bacterium]
MASQVALSPQCAAVLTELNRAARTTAQLSRATGVQRVGAVIHVLRIAGYRIDTQLRRVRTRYGNRANVALYTLIRRRGRPARIRVKGKSRK